MIVIWTRDQQTKELHNKKTQEQGNKGTLELQIRLAVVHALGVASEALEELSDAAAVISIEDTLVLHQKERNNDLDQLRGFNFIYFMTFINGIIKIT